MKPPCRFCRTIDAGYSGFCDTHKRARVNYDCPKGLRDAITAMAAATGADIEVETKGEPEIIVR